MSCLRPSCSSTLQWLRFCLCGREDPGDGGTRFVGKPLVARLQAQGHALTLFTRGRNALSPKALNISVETAAASEGLRALEGRQFDVIVDSSGRKLEDSRRVLEITGAPATGSFT